MSKKKKARKARETVNIRVDSLKRACLIQKIQRSLNEEIRNLPPMEWRPSHYSSTDTS